MVKKDDDNDNDNDNLHYNNTYKAVDRKETTTTAKTKSYSLRKKNCIRGEGKSSYYFYYSFSITYGAKICHRVFDKQPWNLI